MQTETANAVQIAAAIRSGALTASAIVEATLARIAALDPGLNAFTDITAARARTKAQAIDAAFARGEPLPPLAGVPFAVKNLFDIAGLPTRAGSKINRERAPAKADATLVARLEAAGGILVGGLNMGEYAYDFTGENVHDGASRNPHDPTRMSGGSSGGSGTAVAAGLVPLTLGSDTNGSIRVPSSLCGLFGLKPTFGRLSRHGTFPFVASLDHLGPIARSVEDLALSYDLMQGVDPHDHAQTERPFEPTLPGLADGIAGLRIARASGYFRAGASPQALKALDTVAAALGTVHTVEIPHAARARAAAYLITTAEGAALHLDRLRERAFDFDPDTRDRFLAGALVPAAWVNRAQRLRSLFRREMNALFETVDVILAPATPVSAPRLGERTLVIDGVTLPLRPNLGLYTQPISFIGLPVVAVPVWLKDEAMPIGVQVIAAPWREDVALRVARWLEQNGTCAAPVAAGGGAS